MRLDELYFYEGEKRYVQFEVISTKNEKVVISESNYTMKHDDVVVDSGTCEIVNGSVLQILICPPDVGSYDLEITYNLALEVRKIRCKIHVY